MISRDEIIAYLYDSLKEKTIVEALWVSGSAAFNRIDQYSDIDIRVLARSECFSQIFSVVESSLNILDTISDSYSPSSPKPLKHQQRFYRLKNASPFHIIDFVVLTEEMLDLVLDKNRHGTPEVKIDKQQRIMPQETPSALLKDFTFKLEDIKSEFRVLSRILVEKAIARGQFAEAMQFYNTKVISPLMTVLRHHYCPERQDFGLRYMQWDLPKDVQDIVNKLHAISSFRDLKKCLNLAEKLFWKTTNLSSKLH